MTNRQLNAIEKRFGIKLPTDYRQLVLAPPSGLVALLDITASECNWHETQLPLFTDTSLIRDINEMVRDRNSDDFIFDESNLRRRWPKKYFVIGADVGGNLFCIVPNSKATKVFQWHHDDSEFEKCSDSVEQYIRHLFDLCRDLALMKLRSS